MPSNWKIDREYNWNVTVIDWVWGNGNVSVDGDFG
jgi:hypothetical protein